MAANSPNHVSATDLLPGEVRQTSSSLSMCEDPSPSANLRLIGQSCDTVFLGATASRATANSMEDCTVDGAASVALASCRSSQACVLESFALQLQTQLDAMQYTLSAIHASGRADSGVFKCLCGGRCAGNNLFSSQEWSDKVSGVVASICALEIPEAGDEAHWSNRASNPQPSAIRSSLVSVESAVEEEELGDDMAPAHTSSGKDLLGDFNLIVAATMKPGDDLMEDVDMDIVTVHSDKSLGGSKRRVHTEKREILKDKLTYVVCVALTVLLSHLLLREGHQMELVHVHTVLYTLLMILRYWQYQKFKYQYFMIDYCYAMNWLVIGWALFLPKETEIFCMLYGVSFGLMFWSVLFFHNSLVLHSIDKFTSCYLHVMPAAIMFKFRWSSDPDFGVCTPSGNVVQSLFVESNCAGMEAESDVLLYIYGGPYLLFLGHKMIQNFLVLAIPKVRKDPEYLTAARYAARQRNAGTLLQHDLEKKVQKCCKCLSKGGASVITSFTLGMILFTVTQLPVYVFFRSFYANAAILLLMLTACTWNGATFYMDHFVLRYVNGYKNYYHERMKKKGWLVSKGTQTHTGRKTIAMGMSTTTTGRNTAGR